MRGPKFEIRSTKHEIRKEITFAFDRVDRKYLAFLVLELMPIHPIVGELFLRLKNHS